MKSLDSMSVFVKEHSEAICGVLEIDGFIPVSGIVTDRENVMECTIKEKKFNIGLSVLSMLPVIGDLVTLARRLSITVNSELRYKTGADAIKKAANMRLLITELRGKAQTGATGLEGLDKLSDTYLQMRLQYIKNAAKKKKIIDEKNIADDKGEVFISKKWKKLRICTDGKRTVLMDTNGTYGDNDHGPENSTSCFGGSISADQIPYIVIPDKVKMYKYRYSLGVIIAKNGDYLYCVVAEAGPPENGMGEVSIYAAWKMYKLDIYFDTNSSIELGNNYLIAGSNKYKEKFKFILFEKSAPDPKVVDGRGWNYKDAKEFNKQIVRIGKKCYKKGKKGNCLN